LKYHWLQRLGRRQPFDRRRRMLAKAIDTPIIGQLQRNQQTPKTDQYKVTHIGGR
jgi:hypothetical protein